MTTQVPAIVGLIVRRSPRQFATDPFYPELVGGIEHVVGKHGMQVLMRVVDGMPRELESYRRWTAERSVRAVVVVDIVPDDPRPSLISELRLPAVIVGEPDPSVSLPAVRTDNYAAMRGLVSHLAGHGHRRIARVTGLNTLIHTQERTRGFLDGLNELLLAPLVEEGDYSPEAGAAATRRLLAAKQPPTAVIYDNDVMALAGLQAAHEMGIAIPERLSLVAWDDSAPCLLSSPPLSVMSHDVHGRGILTAHSLLAVIDGKAQRDVFTEPSVFVPRGSTAPAGTCAR